MRGTAQSPVCRSCRFGKASAPGACPFYEVNRPAGAILISQGSKPRSVWYLRRGRVALTTIHDQTGVEVACVARGPDSVFGVEATFNRPANYQVRALTDVTLCCLEHTIFSRWLGSMETPAGAILELALREVQQRTDERAGLDGSAQRRVARYLVDYLRDADASELSTLPQKLIAKTLGMRAETLSRALSRLRQRGALAAGRRITIADQGALEQVASESVAFERSKTRS